MYSRILHLYGPLWINSYGLMIALGIFLFLWLIKKHPGREKVIAMPTLIDALIVSVISAVIGGRIFYVLEYLEFYRQHPLESIIPWEGGFSSVGSVIAVLTMLPLFLIKHQVSVLRFFDLSALHAPIIHAFGRIGCFLAGCCYGLVSHTSKLTVVYTDPYSIAPLNVPLYPTQLYESLGYFVIFFILKRLRITFAGGMLSTYLILMSLFRFTIEFWRGDWDRVALLPISFSQVMSVILCVIGILSLLCFAKLSPIDKE